MKIITEVFSPTVLQSYKQSGVTTIMVTTDFLSSKYPQTTSVEELKIIVDQAKSLQLEKALLINRLIMEKEWQRFQVELSKLQHIEFDYFVVHDLGVMHTLKQQHPKVPIIFFSDTTIANELDVDFLLNHGAELIVLARELTIDKKLALLKKFGPKMMMSVFGHQVMSTSYRPLLSNYFKEINKEVSLNQQVFRFKEQNRTEYTLGLEDQHGFHMYTDEIVSLLSHLDQIKEHQLTFAYIDAAFLPQSLICLVAKTIVDGYQQEQFIQAFNQLNLNKTIGEGLSYTDTTSLKEDVA